MRLLVIKRIVLWLLLSVLYTGCVSLIDQPLPSTINIIMVDGTVTNLPEPQIIRLNLSKADPLTGRFGTIPITKAEVEVVEDSVQVITCHETVKGNYQLPSDFRGRVGHVYQLRFVLTDGTRYQSNPQTMLAVPSIRRVYSHFNPVSLTDTEMSGFRAAHDFYVDTQDPGNERNYYRWNWKLWESQSWCRTCENGQYSVNNVITKFSANGLRYFVTGDSLYENCFYPPSGTPGLDRYFVYDYECRTRCWAIFYDHTLNVFADTYTNGSLLTGQKVAQIPYYQHAPCLVEIRQTALNPLAYQYYKQLEDQTQKTGSVVDAPPTTISGNIHNLNNSEESIFGYFTASAVSATRYWLDRKDAAGLPLGATDPAGSSGLTGAELFYAMNSRQPKPEPSPPNNPIIQILINSMLTRPYTAVCESSESQTPVKPEGWRE